MELNKIKDGSEAGLMFWFRFIYAFIGTSGILSAIYNIGKQPLFPNLLGECTFDCFMFMILLSDYKWGWVQKIIHKTTHPEDIR